MYGLLCVTRRGKRIPTRKTELTARESVSASATPGRCSDHFYSENLRQSSLGFAAPMIIVTLTAVLLFPISL